MVCTAIFISFYILVRVSGRIPLFHMMQWKQDLPMPRVCPEVRVDKDNVWTKPHNLSWEVSRQTKHNKTSFKLMSSVISIDRSLCYNYNCELDVSFQFWTIPKYMGIKSSSQGNEENRQERGNAELVPADTTTSETTKKDVNDETTKRGQVLKLLHRQARSPTIQSPRQTRHRTVESWGKQRGFEVKMAT